MLRELNVAVVGATGAVGREFLKILEQRPLPIKDIQLLSSKRSAGSYISVAGREIVVKETTPDCFDNVDIAFISVSADVSRQFAQIAVDKGALVIDDSSAFRMIPDVPLVVPEVNGRDVQGHKGIISIPNCCTTPLAMILYPLHRINPIKRVVVDTYQSVSGAGGQAMIELSEQSKAVAGGRPIEPQAFQHQIAFNLFPQIGDFYPSGYSDEEEKMIDETRKILHCPNLRISATCVRVPVYKSHSEAVHLELEHPMGPQEALECLREMPGVAVMDDDGYATPWNVAGTDDVYVGRVRKDQSVANGLAMWIVADNLRKGAALNALQIAEEVLRRDCLRG